MDMPPFQHRRYVPFSDNSSFYHSQPSSLPPPPLPPVIPALPPAPPPELPPLNRSLPPSLPLPPPPPHCKFSFLPNPVIEHASPQFSNFIPSHLLKPPRPPPRLPSPPRISPYPHNNRTQLDDNSRFTDPWPDLPPLPRALPEPPVHHHDHHRPVSPFRHHSGSYPEDFQPRFSDEFINEGFRGDANPQLPFWGRKDTRFDGLVDDYKYQYGGGREKYERNSDRKDWGFVSADSDFGLHPSKHFKLDVRNYDLHNDREADLRWRNSSLEMDRECGNNNSSSLHLHAERLELFESSTYEDVSRFKDNMVGEKRADEFMSRLPNKKQVQRRSALQRIQLGKANNNKQNRSHDHNHVPKSYHDESNSSGDYSFKGKGTDAYVQLEHEIEENREKSPVELDVSFKSNALVAKAIKAIRSPVGGLNRKLMPRNRRIRKTKFSDSPGIKLRESSDATESSTVHFDMDPRDSSINVNSDKIDMPARDLHHSPIPIKGQKSREKGTIFKTDNCACSPDTPSGSDKDLGQLANKISVSAGGNLSLTCSEPSSSGPGEKGVNKKSPKSVESGQDVKGVASVGTGDRTPKKRKRGVVPIQSKRDSHEATDGDHLLADSPLQALPLDEGLSNSIGITIVSAACSEFLAGVFADEKVQISSEVASQMKKDKVDIKSCQPYFLPSSATASILKNPGDGYACEAAYHAEISVHDDYTGLNFGKGVKNSFHYKPILFENGPGEKVIDSVQDNATNKSKVQDGHTESYASKIEGGSTSSSEQRSCGVTEKSDFAAAKDNSEEPFPNHVYVTETYDIIQGSPIPISSVGNSDVLWASPSNLEAAPEENTASVNSTFDLQLGSMDIDSQRTMDDFVSSKGEASTGHENCQINLAHMENLASFSNNSTLHDVSCDIFTDSADRFKNSDHKALIVTSFPEDVPSTLLLDEQNCKSRQSKISNGHSGKEKTFPNNSLSAVDTGTQSSFGSKTDVKLGPELNLPVNSQSLLPLSQNNSKVIQNSKSLPDKSSISNNLVTTAIDGGFLGHTSVKCPSVGKALPFNVVSCPRTWHRTGSLSQSVVGPKNHVSSRINLQKVLGKVQSSYVRKGNSLVLKLSPVAAVSQGLHASSPTLYKLSPGDNLKKATGSERGINIVGPSTSATIRRYLTGPEKPKSPSITGTLKSLNCPAAGLGDSTCSPADSFRKRCPDETLDPSNLSENMDLKQCSEDGLKPSGVKECVAGSGNNLNGQSVIDERSSEKKITYVKRKSNQLVAFSDISDGYYKRRKNQLIRTSTEDNVKQSAVVPLNHLSSQRREDPKNTQNKSCSKWQTEFVKKKFSPVWTLHGTLSPGKNGNSGQLHFHTVWPFLFPWKRATYWINSRRSLSSTQNDNLASTISQKLLLPQKRKTIYKKSFSGFSLQRSKVLSFSGRSLKWSKSMEKNSVKADEGAIQRVVAVGKRKIEQNGAAFTPFKSRNYVSSKSVYCTKLRPEGRVFRIGSERYRMDPTGKTLQRIPDEEASYSENQSESKAKKSFVPRRLLIGNDEYVRIGNGNQLVRDPKKRTRVLANEKVRWSLHTARLRLARKKYCQFFTRFGKCNKDDKKCPYIHDPAKIAVCTKFLNGCCSDSNCKLTHKVIPERMQDCSYFLQGLCSNESCPYRHVNVNPNSPICEGFLRGYCADANECRKKHTYVCPEFEATRKCQQGSKCKLHHPRTKMKGIKSKASTVKKNARGRYFGAGSIDIANSRTTVPKITHRECDDRIFCQDGRFTDFISLADAEEAKEEDVKPRVELSIESDREEASDTKVNLDDLIKPLHIMKKNNLVLDSSPEIYSTGEITGSY